MSNASTKRFTNELMRFLPTPPLLFLGTTSEKDQKIMASKRKWYSFTFLKWVICGFLPTPFRFSSKIKGLIIYSHMFSEPCQCLQLMCLSSLPTSHKKHWKPNGSYEGLSPGKTMTWGKFVFFFPLPLFKVYYISSYYLQTTKEWPAIHCISVPRARYKKKQNPQIIAYFSSQPPLKKVLVLCASSENHPKGKIDRGFKRPATL